MSEIVNVYNPGTEVLVKSRIKDTTSGVSVLYDPASVIFHYKSPSGTIYTKTYLTDSEVVKVSTGIYTLKLFVPYASSSVGIWHYDCQALDSDGKSIIVMPGKISVRLIQTLQS